MKYKIAVLFAWVLICASKSSTANACKCELPLSFLDELGCNKTYEKNSCCPKKYECLHLENQRNGTCQFMGRTYDSFQYLPSGLLSASCYAHCFCSPFYPSNRTYFQCRKINCPSASGYRPNLGCEWKFNVTQCCEVGEICPSNGYMDKCKINGNFYHVGELYYPEEDESLKCVCAKGFVGQLQEPYCVKKKCLTELKHSVAIRNFCAAVFLKTHVRKLSCPDHFICPKATDKIQKNAIPSEDNCQYGNKFLNIGDKFRRVELFIHEREEYNCQCEIPPFVTCIKTTIHLPPFVKKDSYIPNNGVVCKTLADLSKLNCL